MPVPAEAISVLRGAVDKGRLAHALLFEGPKNGGQREAATWLVRALFCRERTGSDPCEVCTDCRQAGQGTHPDLYILEPEEDSRVIKIEPVRALISRMGLRPLTAPAKVFIIEPAEFMNEASQNALLKSLEEPGGASYFLLISYDPEALLPTIRSRVQRVRFSEQEGGAAADPEAEALWRTVLDHVLYGKGRRPDLSRMVREDLVRIFDRLSAVFRELLLTRVQADKVLGPVGLLLDRKRMASYYDEDELVEKLELLGEYRQRLLEQANQRLALAVFWEAFGPAKLKTGP